MENIKVLKEHNKIRAGEAARAIAEKLNQPYKGDHAKYGIVFYPKRKHTRDGKHYVIVEKCFKSMTQTHENGSMSLEEFERNRDTGFWAMRKVPGGWRACLNIKDPNSTWIFVFDSTPENQPSK